MPPLSRVASAIVRSKSSFRPSQRWYSSEGKVFAAGDYVLLREGRDGERSTKLRMGRDGERLIKLQADQTVQGHRGVIPHNDIIGKRVRDTVTSATFMTFRLQDPTLAEYVRLTRRLAAPLYGYDASTIVSLLDLHVPSPDSPPLEILEAGTGHGSLTLHLSRAIHTANPPKPQTAPTPENNSGLEDTSRNKQNTEDVASDAIQAWKKSRRAIVHTIDISAQHSEHAEKVVKGFRHGLYEGPIDFHVGDVSEWITKQLEIRGSNKPFLDYVILDLASAEDHLLAVSNALRPGGMLAVFNPSITQIADVETAMRSRALQFSQDQVVELAPPRLWEVTVVQPRKHARNNFTETKHDEIEDKSLEADPSSAISDDITENTLPERTNAPAIEVVPSTTREWVTVARPQFYGRTSGNGFLGLWHKMRDAKLTESKEKTTSEHL